MSEASRRVDNNISLAVDDDPGGNLAGLIKAISADVSGRGAGASDGIRAIFALRILGVQRSGLPAAQVAAAVFALKQEMQGALAAQTQNQANERSGRIAAAVMQHSCAPRQRDDRAAYSKQGPPIRRDVPSRAERIKSFKAAAKATLSPAPAVPQSRRRRGGRGGGMVGFHIAGRNLVFRPARLPSHAYDPALAYLADTLHWLELWDDPGALTEENTAGSSLQNLLSPSL